MAKRKKKYMLLRGKFGTFIVVERAWYDRNGGYRRHRMWKIVRESDDRGMLCAMAGLTDRFVTLNVEILSDY